MSASRSRTRTSPSSGTTSSAVSSGTGRRRLTSARPSIKAAKTPEL
jgi:hypothetical protein